MEMGKVLPLSNLQVELLKLYASNVDEADLVAINNVITKYFSEKVQDKLFTYFNFT